ncbi:MAG: transcription elongation factor GreB [Myxococcales bacterium]|nr:transcription elongation factor GreB [Myxococcales bacterium]
MKPKNEAKNYITPEGYDRLAAEWDFLRHKKRPAVVSALADAAAEGDRSENAEYIYRKKQLREIDRRLQFLSGRLDIAEVVNPKDQPQRDRVFFGAEVTVTTEEEDEVTYRIIGEDEIDGKRRWVSWKSPIGKALLGKKLDDTVIAEWHAGQRELTIVAIRYDWEGSGVMPEFI